MQEAVEEYRGYQIVVVPIKDCEDLWDFEYRLTRGSEETRFRSQTAGGYMTADVACFAGIEVAHTEVDNLLALEAARQQ
ncbi:MAG: hypothetical protein ABWY27_16855 [Telluria sp.]